MQRGPGTRTPAKRKPSAPAPRPSWGAFAIPTDGLLPPVAKPPAPKAAKPSKPDYPNPTGIDRGKSAPKHHETLPAAFRVPAASSILGDKPLLPPGPPLKEHDRLAIDRAVAASEAERAAIVANNKRIDHQRLDQEFLRQTASDVAARAGLAGVHSFGQGGVAKEINTFTPNLTDRVALARARQQLIDNHGLGLTPDQHLQQSLAKLHVQQGTLDKPAFVDTHQLPFAAVHGFPTARPAPQPSEEPPRPSGGAWGTQEPSRPNPREQLQAIQPGQSHDTLSQAFDLGEHQSWRTALDRVARMGEPDTHYLRSIDRTLGTFLDAANPWGDTSSLTMPFSKLGKPGQGKTVGEAITGIRDIGLGYDPAFRVARKYVHNATHAGLHEPVAGAADTGIPVDQAAALGFTPEYTKLLMAQALKRGWYPMELRGLIGMDLFKHAHSNPPPHGLRELQNLGTGAAQTAAAVTGFAGLGKELVAGNRTKALGELGSAFKDEATGFIDNPLQAAMSDPFTVIPAVGALGKTAGLVGTLKNIGKEMPLREIRTGLYHRTLGEGELGPPSPEIIYGRGQLAKNSWTQAWQKGSDALVRRGYGMGPEHAKVLDRLVRNAINQAAHGHTVRQVAYRDAVRGLAGRFSAKKKRAEVLLDYLHHGGTPEESLQTYQAMEKAGVKLTPEQASRAKHLAETVIPETRNLSEADQHFIDTARDLSVHTSLTHNALGRFRLPAILYRQLEPLLLNLDHRFQHAHPGELTPMMEAAHEIMRPGGLRDEYLNAPHAPNAPYDSARVAPRRGKISEAARQEDKGFGFYQEEYDKALAAKPGPAPVDAGAAAHEAALAAHKASAPVKPKPVPKGPQGEHPTKYAAGKAGKAAMAEHGAIGVKVRQTPEVGTAGKVETNVAKVTRRHREKAVEDAAKLAKEARAEFPGAKVTGGVNSNGAKHTGYATIEHPGTKTGGHWTWELTHQAKTPGGDVKLVAYRARLKKWLARNPKPTDAAELKVWMSKRPKPPQSDFTKARLAHKAATPVRDPKELAAHAEAVAKHKADVRAWERRVRDARTAMRAHGKNFGAAGRRRANLQEAETKQFAAVSDQASIAHHYQMALEEFLQMHLDRGGIAPARIQYTKARAKSFRRAAGRSGARLNPRSDFRRNPPVHASSGSTYRSGNYLIDANSPIRESVHAQRLRTGLGVHHLVVEHLAQRVPKDTEVPKDMVAVSVRGLANLTHVEHMLGEGSNPSMQVNYELEHSLRSGRAQRLTDLGVEGTGDMTRDESYLIPKATYERMIQWTKPVSMGAYSKAMREYQRMLISMFPGTVIGNTLGSIPLAMAAGALPGTGAYRMAARTMRRGGHGRSLAPHYLYGKGPSGSLEADAHLFYQHYMNKMRGASIQGEDFSRVAAYWAKALPIVRREGKRLKAESEAAHAESQIARAEHAGKLAEHENFVGPGGPVHPGAAPELKEALSAEASFEEAAKGFAAGHIKPHLLDDVLDHVEKFMGDTHKPLGAIGARVQGTHIILFQNWVTHMAKLVLYSLPVKHPRRMLFLNTMARYGDQYRQENGAWPSWMVGFLPLFHETSRVPGIDKLPGGAEIQHWTHVFNLMQLNPQATAGGLMQSLTEDKPLVDRLLGVAQPFAQAGWDFGKKVDESIGADPDKKVDPYRLGLNEILGTIPGERKLFPQTGLRPDSLPWDKTWKTYSDPLAPGTLLSPFLAPSPRADQWPWGFVERALGFGGYQVPNNGPIQSQNISSEEMRAIKAEDPGAQIAVQLRQAQRDALQGAASRAASGP